MPGTMFDFEIVWECWVSQTFSAASVGWPISTHLQRFWHLLQTRHAKTLFCFCRASSLRLQICPKHFVVGMKLGARRKRSWNMVPLHHAKLSWQTNTTKNSSYMFILVHLMAVHLGNMTTCKLSWMSRVSCHWNMPSSVSSAMTSATGCSSWSDSATRTCSSAGRALRGIRQHYSSFCVRSLIRATRCNMIIMPCEIMCHDAPSRDTCETCAAKCDPCETLSHTATLSLSLRR